ncbi:putative virion structural protein [Salmonella phage pSal-SNUABM-04]|nr:putative virion structural protein [Salmonella phage pSal-SNUABM-04]
MTIQIKWPSQASKGLTSIELYRKVGWNATLDVVNPGTPYKVLDAGATSFTEDVKDLTEKTIYSYWVAAVKGDERLIGAKITQAFYLDTGPGAQAPIRGDWVCGYFGRLTKAEFFNRQEVLAQLTTAQQNIYQYEVEYWHKFVYRGKILFFSENPQGYATLQNIYNVGMMSGADDLTITPSGVAKQPQNVRVQKDGRQYIVRLPWGNIPGEVNGWSIKGEWCSTMGRMYGASGSNNADTFVPELGVSAPFWNDLPVLSTGGSAYEMGAVPVIPLYSTNGYYYAYGYRPMSLTSNTGVTTNNYVRYVFELILP